MMHRAQRGDAVRVEVRVAEVPAQHRLPGPASARSSAVRDQHGALALAQVVAGRLAGLRPGRRTRRARRRAAGTPRRAAARTPSTPRAAPGSAPASAPPSCSGPLDRVLRRLVARSRAMARAAEPPPRACSSRSRYCPAISSVRIRSKTGWPRSSASAGSPLPANSSSAQDRHRSPSRIAAPVPNASGDADASRCRGAAPRTGGARRAARGGCRCASITSSWIRAHACSSSSAAAAAHGRVAVGAARAAPAPVAERRPQPLAAGEQVGQGGDQRGELVADAVELRALPRQERVEAALSTRPRRSSTSRPRASRAGTCVLPHRAVGARSCPARRSLGAGAHRRGRPAARVHGV